MSELPPIGAEHPGPRTHALASVVLLLALVLVYGEVGEFEYVAIDDVFVTNPAPIRAGLTTGGVLWAFTTFHSGNWLPLTWISHMLDVTLFGLAPGPMHLVNVALHGATSLLVYAFAVAVLRNGLAGLIVALLFLIHPLHVESVAWVAERKDVLCGLFFVMSLLAYLRYAACPSTGRYAVVVTAFGLALLSKSMAVTLPVVLLLLDFWPLGRLRTEPPLVLRGRLPHRLWPVLEKLPLFALSLALGLVTLAAQGSAVLPLEAVPVASRLLNSVIAYATYLRDMVAPTGLAVFYPFHRISFWQAFLPPMVLLCAISAAALRWRARFPWFLFGWLWFLLTLLPVIGLIQVGVQSHADRYMYLPSIGPFVALGAAVATLTGWARRAAMLTLAPALAFHAYTARVQVGHWSDTGALVTHALEVVGDSVPLHTMLAGFHLAEGRVQQAEEHAMQALRLSSGSALAYSNLGTIMLIQQRYSLAERMFRLSVSKSRPRASTLANTLNNLAIALEKQGRIDEARPYFAAALEADPNLRQARENLERLGRDTGPEHVPD